MGIGLMEYAVFSRSVLAADEYLKSIGADWSVCTEMLAFSAISKINRSEFSQPLCSILQVAAVDLLRHWGLVPIAVVGHSSGEIAAAYACGALSAQDAWKIAYHRGRLSESLKTIAPALNGAMMSVGLSEEDVQPYLHKDMISGTVVIACINSPTNITLSGDHSALLELEKQLQQDNVFVRMLKVQNAYHSPHMEVVAGDYLEAISDVEVRPEQSDVRLFSSVNGAQVQSADLAAPYWVQNMVQPVQFVKALDQALESVAGERKKRREALRIDCAVEIGPHGALRGPLMQFLTARQKKQNVSYYSVLSRGENATRTMLTTIGQLWSLGARVDLQKVNEYSYSPFKDKALVDLPAYPWNHTNSYWHESSQSKNHRFRKFPRLDYLGAPVEDFNSREPLWKGVLRASEVPWILDHKVQNDIIFPGAGMICTVLQAARQLSDQSKRVLAFEFRDITIQRALIVPHDESGIEVFTHIKPRKTGMRGKATQWLEFTYYSRERDGSHNEHCSGLFQIHYDVTSAFDKLHGTMTVLAKDRTEQEKYEAALTECTEDIDRDVLYSTMKTAGLNYGPTFQGMTTIKAGELVACTEVTIPDTISSMPSQCESEHLLHPATLDAFFQSSFPAILRAGILKQGMIPPGIGHLWIAADVPQGAGNRYYGTTRVATRGFREMEAAITMINTVTQEPAVIIQDYVATGVGSQGSQMDANDSTSVLRSKICCEVRYHPDIDLLTQRESNILFDAGLDGRAQLRLWQSHTSELARIWIQHVLETVAQYSASKFDPDTQIFMDWIQQGGNLKRIDNSLHPEVPTRPSDDTEKLCQQQFNEVFPANAPLVEALFRNPEAFMSQHCSVIDLLQNEGVSLSVGPFWASGARMISQWIVCASCKNPDMRVLELNARTPAIASPVLEQLGRKSSSTARLNSYIYSHPSSGPLDLAREALVDWSEVTEYKLFDVSHDISDQGFTPETMDVIVLDNTLNSFSNFSPVLQNCWALLKPGGKLLLSTVTNPTEWAHIMHYGLPGWKYDLEDQPIGPFMNKQQWTAKLLEVGFSEPDYVVHDTTDPDIQAVSMIVSTKLVRKQSLLNNFVVLRDPTSKQQCLLADSISKHLSDSGYTPCELSLREAATTDGDKLSVSEQFVVSLLETDKVLLADIGFEDFENLKAVILQSSCLLWVTCTSPDEEVINPYLRTISGLIRGISADDESMRLHELHLHHDLTGDNLGAVELIHRCVRFIHRVDDGCAESEILEKDGLLCIPRYYDDENVNHRLAMTDVTPAPQIQPLLQTGRPLKLTIGSPGVLDTLHFVDDPVQLTELPDNFVEVEVKANAMNFVDIMVSMGQVPDTTLGMDAAGIVSKIGCRVTKLQVGDRVAFCKIGAFATILRVPEDLPQKLPDHMTLEQGCTIPIIWTTAYHALIQIADLQRGETILIHAAAGGLGMALVQLAQHVGAEIFATVSTAAKRELITSMGVAEDHIFNSRDHAFAQSILRMTNCKGVEVVINNLAGESLRKAWECIADFGRFVEVGKKDILENTGLEMMPFLRNTTFSGVNIEHMLRNYLPKMIILLRKVMSLFHEGTLKPIQPITEYDWSDLETCFRTMQQGRHVGKLVLKMTPESNVPAVPRDPHPLKLDANAAYVLVGGLGGLGRGQAVRLAERGARFLAFLSCSGSKSSKAQETLDKLKSMGVKAIAYACDITNKECLSRVRDQIVADLAPIKGVIQGAMVLADGVFEKLSHEKWLAATRPKIQGTWNLHEVMPKDLDFFVLLSSMVGITGGRTQPNYAAGNTFMDAFAQYRRSLGLPAQTINLGIISGLGYVEENKDNAELAWVMAMEMITIKPPQFYAMFEAALTGYSRGEEKLPPAITMGAGSGGLNAANLAAGCPYEIPWLYRFAHFAYLKKLDLKSIEASTGGEANEVNEIKNLLSTATTLAQAAEACTNAISSKLAKSMMIVAADIDPTKPLHHYGVDSLVAVEVRNWIFRDLKSDVSIFDILSNVPMSQLGTKIAEKSRLVKAELRGEGEGS